MSDGSSFPRRDENGRVTGLLDLLAISLATVLLGIAAVAGIDAVFTLFGAGRFGRVSGWLAAVLPFLVLSEDFRAWRPLRWRWAVALAAMAAGLALGLLAADAVTYLPPLWSGAVGATVAVLAYAAVWYFGVRRLP